MGDSIKPASSSCRIAAIAALFLLTVFIVYYTVMTLAGTARKTESINAEFGFRPDGNKPVDERIFTDSLYVKLRREKAWLQARSTMAASDSISLSVNLSDSTACLEIQGVTVHRSKISNIEISRIFGRADEYALASLLSVPFTVKRDYASLKKEPVMLKIAPKDTSEYKPDILPDTSNTAPVNYILETENGFRIYIYETIPEGSSHTLGRFMFDLGYRFRNSWAITRSILAFRIPEYHPAIRISVPRADARIIYRGLPRRGQIALFR